MEQEFSNIWFSTEKQFKNRARFYNFSDRGSLSLSFGKLQFTGQKYNIAIKNIKTIDVTYPLVPWTSIILSIIFSFIFLGIFVVFFAWGTNTLRLIPIPVVIMPVVYLILFVPFSILIQKIMLWVEVTYLDDNNVLQYAYFFDGSLLGWRGILGGSLEMYKKLRQHIMLAVG